MTELALRSVISRDVLSEIERRMNGHPAAVHELPVEHYLAPGLYGRALHIPADTLITGKIHKYQHLSVLLKGTMRVLIGSRIETVRAPLVYVSEAGTKRIAHTVTDTIWLTVHGFGDRPATGIPTTDVEDIETALIAATEEEFLAHTRTLIAG